MSAFVTPIAPGTALTRVTPSAPAPDLRFARDPLMWIGVPGGTPITAFATGPIARSQGASNGIPGNPAAAWTLFQLAPLPQMNPGAFKRITGGLPVQLVLIPGTAGPSPATDDCLVAGTALTTAPAGGAFLAFAFQDRLCRDPLTSAEAIAASGACDAAWAQFVTDLGNLVALHHARNLRVLDHRGAPATSGSVAVSINGAAATTVTLDAGKDGDTGIVIRPTARATVSYASAAHPVVASGDDDTGAFRAGLQLAAGKRMVQVLDAGDWLASPDPGVQVSRMRPGNLVEPIQEGTPYFGALVEDLRRAKPGGKAQLAGWVFMKGSLADDKVDWPLVPGDASTALLKLIQELRGANVQIGMLVNQFLRFDSPVLDDFPDLAAILLAYYASLLPQEVLLNIQTDPAGYVMGILAIVAIDALLQTSVPLDLIKSHQEFSKPLVDELAKIDPTIATWTPYDAAFSDNPLVTPPPFKVLGFTIDDISHIGVYHQKYVTIKRADGSYVAYLGGIDINSDRPDTTIHRAVHPFHDVQVRVTGDAVLDLILSYEERAKLHGAPIPITLADAGPQGSPGSHLVQIARTYFARGAASPTAALPFAPNGESTSANTIYHAIGQARDFIYIEDQYFTPPDEYVHALISAADSGVRALMITMPYQTDQPYGGRRRNDVLNALQTKWGDRFYAGTPLRRFLHEVAGLTTNLGRMRLANGLTAGPPAQCDLTPAAHVPPPPFWAFAGNELMLVHAYVGGATASGVQTVEIVRAAGTWGATPVAHPAGTPVLAVQVPGIYVHAKVMIVDDVFLFAGSSNINRRGLYHDGEMNSFTIPEHLKGDPANPARLLRSRLMAEHAGLSPEMGQSLFADPISAIQYFTTRSWYQGAPRQPLGFFGSLPPIVSLGTSDSVGSWMLQVLIGSLNEGKAMADVWPLLVDPTTSLDSSLNKGPSYP